MLFWQRQNYYHAWDYLVLLVIFVLVALGVRLTSFSPYFMVVIMLLSSLAYIVWGVVHHKKAGHIDNKIVLEYVGFALLANVLVGILVL